MSAWDPNEEAPAACPICRRAHGSAEHDEGRYFVCGGCGYLIVWRGPDLEVAEPDAEDSP